MQTQPELASAPRDRCTLTMLSGPSPGSVHHLGRGELILGRDDDLPYRIDDIAVSGRHARLFCKAGEFFLEDLGSTNGTFVEGSRIRGTHRLNDGDRVQLGVNTLFRVALQDATEQEAARRLYDAAVRDPLTGVYNRGHFETLIVSEFAFAARHKTPLSVLFIDFDHFSEVNNTHGHQAGDEVLRTETRVISEAIRTEDLLARYGGEEFVLVARGIALEHALILGERVRSTVARCIVPWEDVAIGVTVSIGVASYHHQRSPYASPEQLVAAADRAVYRAKNAGRDRVCAV